MANKFNVKFVDEDGAIGSHQIPVLETMVNPHGALAQAYIASIPGVSNAGIIETSISFDKQPATIIKGTGPYDAEDKMVTAFRTVGGAALRLAIPAPIRVLMESNDEAWKAGEAAIDSLVATAVAVIRTKGGATISGLKRSWRTRRNRKQR